MPRRPGNFYKDESVPDEHHGKPEGTCSPAGATQKRRQIKPALLVQEKQEVQIVI